MLRSRGGVIEVRRGRGLLRVADVPMIPTGPFRATLRPSGRWVTLEDVVAAFVDGGLDDGMADRVADLHLETGDDLPAGYGARAARLVVEHAEALAAAADPPQTVDAPDPDRWPDRWPKGGDAAVAPLT